MKTASEWACLDLTCDARGANEDADVNDKEAAKHGRLTGHSTMTSTVDLRLWNRKGNE